MLQRASLICQCIEGLGRILPFVFDVSHRLAHAELRKDELLRRRVVPTVTVPPARAAA